MSGKNSVIHQLSEHVINKIAAGEVIERPASVVKELVENALDAGATRIKIEVEDGGKKRIQVTDNGRGIRFPDLTLAFKGHATSKLSNVEDLNFITSLGFRGEALASIGAVSMATIRSRQKGVNEGGIIECMGGDLQEPKVAGCPEGTSIEVQNLFFNTPARRKFLKASSTEMTHMTETVARLALAHRETGFELRHGKRLTLSIDPAADGAQRIGAIAGREIHESLIPLRESPDASIGISGFLLPPEKARGRSSGQYCFLNSRYIRDRSILHAVSSAFGEYLIPGRYPVFYLYLSMDPASYDINVHPTKVEVRFASPRLVYDVVNRTVRETLEGVDLVRRMPLVREAPPEVPFTQERFSNDQGVGTGNVSLPPHDSTSSSRELTDEERNSVPDWKSLEKTLVEEDTQPPPRFLQLKNAFIVEETDEGMVVHDQHALHERILHNEILTRMDDGPLDSQSLLVPELIDLGIAECELLVTHQESLTRLGLQIEEFGGPTLAVHAVPALSSRLRLEPFLRDLAGTISEHEGRTPTKEEVLSRAIDTAACKAAVKSGDALAPEEISHLLLLARRVPRETQTCVHGRPTRIHVGWKELERWFERR